MKAALYVLLATVAVAAAVLSFSALRDLAILCGFQPWLAWLLPITLDAGAGAASIVWLARWVPDGARSYGRALALILLGSSVAGNAVDHYLRAYRIEPEWWVVVLVSAVAPSVLAALVHLVMLVARAPEPPAVPQPSLGLEPEVPTEPAAVLDLPVTPSPANDAVTTPVLGEQHSPPLVPLTKHRPIPPPAPGNPSEPDLFLQILARVERDPSIGRPTLIKELGLRDNDVVRQLLRDAKQTVAARSLDAGS